mgnify:CR=1 FL=1
MTDYQVSNIVRDVRIAIDQNQDAKSMENFGDVDTLDLSNLIKDKIEDAAKLIMKAAPLHMIGKGVKPNNLEILYEKVYEGDSQCYAVVKLPADYMRCVTFRMEDWLLPITGSDIITPESPEYALQRSRVVGVRGNKERPVLVLVPYVADATKKETEEDKTEYCYEAYSTDDKKQCYFTYLPIPTISKDKISLPSRLYRAVVYAIAYLTALALNAQAQASVMLSTAKQLAEIQDSVPRVQQQVPEYQQQDDEQ